MRNMQDRHKHIKHMNSFINARRQRKLKIFRKSTFRVLVLGSRIPPLEFGSQILGPTYEMGLGSPVSVPAKSLGSQVPLFRYAVNMSLYQILVSNLTIHGKL